MSINPFPFGLVSVELVKVRNRDSRGFPGYHGLVVVSLLPKYWAALAPENKLSHFLIHLFDELAHLLMTSLSCKVSKITAAGYEHPDLLAKKKTT